MKELKETMKKFLMKVGIGAASCLFFTFIVPILMTSAQNNLYAAGFGFLFLFFGTCLYLLMTSTFFTEKEKTEGVQPQKELEPAA